MSTVGVLIPFAGGCPHRERALEALRGRYTWPVTIAQGNTPWIKAEAVNPAVRASPAEVIVVADADVWHPDVGAAVEAVKQGAPWAMPHLRVRRLTEQGTADYLAGAEPEGLPLEQRPYLGVEGGGYVVARRETLLEVPYDPRFVGWGQEDVSLGLALRTLVGLPWRGRDSLVHLWHPPQVRMTRKYGNQHGRALWKRYARANGDPGAMRSLLAETDALAGLV